MKRNLLSTLGLVALGLLLAAVASGPGAVAEEAAGGQAVFEAQKCNMCHGVPTVGIEAKTQSEKMRGKDLVDLDRDADWLKQYLMKEVQLDDADHKKEFKGTDEELQVLVDWLLEQKSE